MKKLRSKSWSVMLFSVIIMAALITSVCSCKAWRTITTTSTYTLQTDSAANKTTTTIQTKTTEEYQGTRRK